MLLKLNRLKILSITAFLAFVMNLFFQLSGMAVHSCGFVVIDMPVKREIAKKLHYSENRCTDCSDKCSDKESHSECSILKINNEQAVIELVNIYDSNAGSRFICRIELKLLFREEKFSYSDAEECFKPPCTLDSISKVRLLI